MPWPLLAPTRYSNPAPSRDDSDDCMSSRLRRLQASVEPWHPIMETGRRRPMPTPSPPLSSGPSALQISVEQAFQRGGASRLGLGGLSLIDRARALCVAADDVQRATIEASRRIAALHGSPKRLGKTKKADKRGQKPMKEPPDVCARPPSDVPPPRGEGWKRLGPVSVVLGSNRLSAPPQLRRALTREIDVFVDGQQYSIVPVDIDPGGGFCVTLNRDFQGETNMASMLYLRKRGGGVRVRGGGPGTSERASAVIEQKPIDDVEGGLTLPKKVTPRETSRPLPLERAQTLAVAPFGSVGETTPPVPPSHSVSLPTPLSTRTELDLDMHVKTRPEDRDGGNADAVQEAQRRARRRALSQRERVSVEGGMEKVQDHPEKKRAFAEIRLKASRRAALARITLIYQQKEALKEEVDRITEETARKREAEAVATADTLRAAAVARAAIVAAEKRQKARKLEEAKEAEVRARQERVAAVLARKDSDVVDRERQVRRETYLRIKREERRRELEKQRQEDERMEMIRLYEAGERYVAAAPACYHGPSQSTRPARGAVAQPALQSARSFFSVGTRTSSHRSVASSDCNGEGIRALDFGATGVPCAAVELKALEDDEMDTDGTCWPNQQSLGTDVFVAHKARAPAATPNVDDNVDDDQEANEKQRHDRHLQKQVATTTAAAEPPRVRGGRHGRGDEHRPVARGAGLQAARHVDALQRAGQQGKSDQRCPRGHQSQRRSRFSSSDRNRYSKSSPRASHPETSDGEKKSHLQSPTEELNKARVTKYRGSKGGAECRLTADDAANQREKREVSSRLPLLASPESSTGRGPESCSGETTGASASSGGLSSSGNVRRRITGTPVWKRPAVPLTKPYVPVPRRDSSRFTVR